MSKYIKHTNKMSIHTSDPDMEYTYKQLFEEMCEELDRLKEFVKSTTQSKPEITFENTPLNLFKKIIDDEYKKQELHNNWTGSNYDIINLLKNEHSGKTGEKMVSQLCIHNNIDSKYDEDINSKDGTYDIMIQNKKVEIKTARVGLSGSFQHENLRNGGSDYYLFIDVTPQYYYLTIIPHFNLSEKCTVMERKPHLRKGSDNVYKFDFSEPNVIKSTQKGFTIKVEDATTFEEIGNFIRTKIT